MKHHVDIIDYIVNIFIEMNKGIVSDKDMRLITNTYKTLLNKMDEAYRCIRSLIIDDNRIEKGRVSLVSELSHPILNSYCFEFLRVRCYCIVSVREMVELKPLDKSPVRVELSLVETLLV